MWPALGKFDKSLRFCDRVSVDLDVFQADVVVLVDDPDRSLILFLPQPLQHRSRLNYLALEDHSAPPGAS